ncbi:MULTISPECIES: ASCH/PUA domain-containing protein [Bacillus]|uniref:DUF3850 domain-containing protein n=1 Tax=Bacillus swezeyi TaxID=1925020 RepID=A0A5M8RV91_9BACI|nr:MULTISPECIES: ASCH/PUA domain-containing protein [Bacillus]KAA6451300.1 DUF3850 domain-containing protein [Bacillus swezeyi]KAA6482040.1 DUF3850 domain-containing protein [Bacillus swezeyi]TYS35521.1 DUF3850 domain-containing protein [Bacillus swezeyi]VEB19950.1 Domain of Uncharacterised Function with PDB structure [Bacillus paralicheniformis]
MPIRHKLKILPEYFDCVCNDEKTFEIRKNDRGFKVGDLLELYEYIPEKDEYTGRVVIREVTYMTDYAQKDNYVVMAINRLSLIENGAKEAERLSKEIQKHVNSMRRKKREAAE